MSARLFHGGRAVDRIEAGDRGLAYGDGVFETMRVHRGEVPLWPRHVARLEAGASRLALALPPRGMLDAQVAEAAAEGGDGVLKLLVARGDGGRGYAPPVAAPPRWMLSLHALPPAPTRALRLHACATRLATQPALAGIKHCNRLEQVLARAEAEEAGTDEGLMHDMAGHPVCATSANLLAWRDGSWWTPPVEACGVAGVLRGWLLDQGVARIATLTSEAVSSADALALCNAVRGILPVASLGARTWAPHPALDELQDGLAMAFPMFSGAGAGA